MAQFYVSHLLPAFWVSLSTYPPATQGRPALGQRPLLSPRAVKGWALALLQLLGAQGGENQRQAMWAPAFISQLQRGANKPCPHARRCSSSLLTAPACPSLSSPPFQKEDRASVLVPGYQRALTAGRASNAGQRPLCSKKGPSAKVTKTLRLTLFHHGLAWHLEAHML